jgi:cell fate regulator YaaT (PSP1 superfamily)
MMAPREVPEHELVAPLKRVVRVATGSDLDRAATNRENEKRAHSVCHKKIAEHGLPMKLLDAEYSFDGSQVTFSFSAEGRVDFRELVKDLAGALKIKVQLHQIGVRDEAKLIGGYGTCGRELCCASFLSGFDPISMKMAKDQSLFLNPAKFSGVCGKLMCCLRYEHEFYKYAREHLPSVGAIIPTEHGNGRILDVNVVSGMMMVETEGGVIVNVSMKDLNLRGCCRKHGLGCNMAQQNCKPIAVDDEEIPGPETGDQEPEEVESEADTE